MVNVVIFARVSRKDQNYDRQVNELLEYCKTNNYQGVDIITEKVSGSKTQLRDRPSIQSLLEMARAGSMQKVIISEVSRIGRKTKDVLEIIEELHKQNISLLIYNYGLETLDHKGKVNSMAQFLITLLADIARMETATLGERIKSGLEEARRKGKELGRPKGSSISATDIIAKYPGVVKDLKSGDSLRRIAAVREVSIDTVQRVKKALVSI
jgi:DNA invertase Pin-like site-specific DNA recombinase